ncbi:MAG: MFS transporter [Dethiobacteria bacterium]
MRPLSKIRQLGFAMGSAAFTALERMLILFLPFFYLPPAEYGVPNLISNQPYLKIVTVLGAALFLGRFVDGLADPLIAVLSDNCRARPGRRKVFLLASGLPLALTSRPFPAGNRQATGSGWGCCSLFFILLLPLM